MAFHVRDPETDRLVRELAAAKGTSLTETIRQACEIALADVRRAASADDIRRRLKVIHERLAQYPRDESVVIDKAFYDDLNDEAD